MKLGRLTVGHMFSPLVSVSDVLGLPGFAGNRIVAGGQGLGNPVEQVNVIQIPTNRYVKRNELVLAPAAVFPAFDGEPSDLVAAIADRGVTAICIRGSGVVRLLGSSGRRVANERALPLIQLPTTCHLSELQTQVLKQIVDARTRQLQRTREIRSQLADHIVSGGGLEAIPQDIAEIVGGDAVLVGPDGEILASSTGADRGRAQSIGGAFLARRTRRPAQTDDGWIAWPVLAGSRRMGCLVVRLSGQHDRVQRAALQQGATFAALQILHRQEAAEADARFRAGFIRDLLTGALDPEAARRRASAIGWELDSDSFQVLLVANDEGEPDALAQQIRSLAPTALVTEHARGCLVISPSRPQTTLGTDSGHRGSAGQDDHPTADDLASSLCQDLKGLHVGMSAHHAGLHSPPTALAEAQIALRASQIFDGRTRIRRFEELGVLRFLVEVPEEALREFQSSILGPLDQIGQRHRQALLETLELLLQTNLNVAETARLGGWHYNTVRSRARRLQELLGAFVDSGTQFESVCLSLLLRKEMGNPWPTNRSASPTAETSNAGGVESSEGMAAQAPRDPNPDGTRTLKRTWRKEAMHSFTVAQALDLRCLRDAQLVAGKRGLDRALDTAGVLDVTDLGGVRANQFVLTNAYALLNLDLTAFIRRLARQRASALGIKLSTYWKELPEPLVTEAERVRLPILILAEGPFDEIVNPLLTAIAGYQVAALNRSELVHERLTRAALRESGEPSAITQILTHSLKRPSAVFTEEGEPLAVTGPPELWNVAKLRAMVRHGEAGTITIAGVRYFLASAPVGRGTRAAVCVADVNGNEPHVLSATAHAAAVAGMLLVGRRQVEHVYRRYERELLEDLVDGRRLKTDQARARAAGIDWPLDSRYLVLVAGPAHPPGSGTRPTHVGVGEDELTMLRRALRPSDREIRLFLRPPGIGLVTHLDPPDDPRSVAHRLATSLLNESYASGTASSWVVGVSRSRSEIIELADAFREASLAYHFGPRVARGSPLVAHFSDLGPVRLLSEARDRAAIVKAARDTLGGLASDTAARERELLDTLDVLLGRNMNLRAAANDLYFHYNTVRHRLSRLRKNLPGLLDRWDGRLTLSCAVAGIRLFGADGRGRREATLGAGF